MSTMSKHGSRSWEGDVAPMDKVLLIEIISQWTEKNNIQTYFCRTRYQPEVNTLKKMKQKYWRFFKLSGLRESL